MRRRTRYSLIVALALFGALIVAAILRKTAPPETARLLPESDAIVYVDLKPLRAATHFDREWDRNPVSRSADYQHFIDATGILPERDLDAAAFALHRMDDPLGPNGPVAYSEVYAGRFDARRLTQYLGSIASARESYAGHDIYVIQTSPATKASPATQTSPTTKATPARLLRVVQLGYDTIAASNMPTTEQIHLILDRYSASASPFSGSSLLNARYRDVPLLSSAWAIGHIGLPFSESGHISVFGLQLPLPEDTTFVASLRYVGALHLRIEEIAATEADAQHSAETLSAILSLFKSLLVTHPATAPSAEDAAMQKFVESLNVEQRKDHVLLTGSLPLDLLRKAGEPETAPSH
jgi:hypothetical protein